MADKKNETAEGIVNIGGTVTVNGCAIGKGAKIVTVSGKVTEKSTDKDRK